MRIERTRTTSPAYDWPPIVCEINVGEGINRLAGGNEVMVIACRSYRVDVYDWQVALAKQPCPHGERDKDSRPLSFHLCALVF